MSGIFGRISTRLFAKYDPTTSSWKMLRALGRRASNTSSALWPETAMMHDGTVYELLMLARPISEKEFSSLPDLIPTPVASDCKGARGVDPTGKRKPGIHDIKFGDIEVWRKYLPAIRRWEKVLRRSCPGTNYSLAGRINPAFIEWLMGCNAGLVTDPDIGLSWSAQIELLGNSVVTQQAEVAFDLILTNWTHSRVSQSA